MIGGRKMIEDRNQIKKPHNIVMENRKKLNVSGVSEILRFDESVVVVKTSMGNLTIAGEKLNITKSSTESAEMCVEGEIAELVYSNQRQGSGLFARFAGR